MFINNTVYRIHTVYSDILDILLPKTWELATSAEGRETPNQYIVLGRRVANWHLLVPVFGKTGIF